MDDAVILLALLAFGASRKPRGRAAPGRGRSPSPAAKGTQREAVATVQTPDAARSQIVASYREVTGSDPSPAALALLLAHSAGETDWWKKMGAWNYGNVTTLGGHDWFHFPKNRLKFKWYPDAETGGRDWIETLRDSYPDAWDALASGNAARYVRGLVHGRAGCYFGDAPPAVYERMVARLYQQLLPLAEGQRVPQKRPRGQSEWLLPLRDAKP